MAMEWIVAAVFVLVGLVAAVGFWLGDRDPIVRRYKPGVGGLFRIGRGLRRPEFDEAGDKTADRGAPGDRKS